MKNRYRRLVFAGVLAFSGAISAPAALGETLSVYNFAEQRMVSIDPVRLTVDEARDYIPQSPAAMSIFEHFIDTGHSPIDALMSSYQAVLEALEDEIRAQDSAGS